MNQRIIEADTITEGLSSALVTRDYDRAVIITDPNVERDVLPLISFADAIPDDPDPLIVTIPAGESNKNMETAARIWTELSKEGITRDSVAINIGGGVVTDTGGFAAATFKRGLRFINVPTTVLGAVDAAVGGKTGVNFLGLKNEIGVFAHAETVVISDQPFSTLPEDEMLSGYAELIKTLIISSPDLYQQALLMYPREAIETFLPFAVGEKKRITDTDPRESGLRRILNFGHTTAHALESLMLDRYPVKHGRAVAFGMLTALVLSHLVTGIFMDYAYTYRNEILRSYFGSISLGCDDIDRLLLLMGHDKKNRRAGEIGFVLLRNLGDPVFVEEIPPEDIRTALEFTFS